MNRTWLIVFGDFVSFLISFILLIIIRFNPQDYSRAIDTHTIPFLILYLFWVLIFYIFGLYDLVMIKPTIPYLKRWIWSLASSFVIGLLLFYFAPIFGISPKVNLFIQVVLFGIFSFIFRRSIYTIFAKTLTRPAIFIGSSPYLIELKNAIEKNPQIGLQIINHLQNIKEIEIGKIKTKDLIIILDKQSDATNYNIINLYKQGVEIIDTAKAYEKYLFKIPVEYIDTSFIVENVNVKNDILYSIITFIINKIFSLLILIILSPLLLISGLLIYLHDKGPIFYIQARVGLNGKIFQLYKLRSMICDSEKDGAAWSTGSNDPRVTPIGKIIRKLHIDEIPQMINILKGDISLVGPRPERPEFVKMLDSQIPYYSFRHIIRPGFTGWAQIKYYYASTVEGSKEKFEFDLYYIKNRNIFLDFGIIIRTIQIIFTH
jgi:exopolysaccharide biosynthesis polyprenyl glycosylphosphotransferase